MNKPVNKSTLNTMEVWKDIPGFEGKYRISNNAVTFNIITGKYPQYFFRDGGIQKTKNKKGGERICVCLDRKIYQVARLVAQTFIPNPDNLPCVNHKDENPLNNCVENLEWCTHQYNSNYGTLPSRRKEWGRKMAKKIAMIDNDGNIVKTFEAISDASRYLQSLGIKVNIYNISAVLNKIPKKGQDGVYRLRKKAGGYHWEFI